VKEKSEGKENDIWYERKKWNGQRNLIWVTVVRSSIYGSISVDIAVLVQSPPHTYIHPKSPAQRDLMLSYFEAKAN
jgi:hypothetical protein